MRLGSSQPTTLKNWSVSSFTRFPCLDSALTRRSLCQPFSSQETKKLGQKVDTIFEIEKLVFSFLWVLSCS